VQGEAGEIQLLNGTCNVDDSSFRNWLFDQYMIRRLVKRVHKVDDCS